MRLYRIVAATYESAPYPILEHIFYGRTPEEAQSYFNAHLTTDEFFRGCTLHHRWKNLACQTRIVARGWVEK